jgi:hypothetical protein
MFTCQYPGPTMSTSHTHVRFNTVLTFSSTFLQFRILVRILIYALCAICPANLLHFYQLIDICREIQITKPSNLNCLDHSAWSRSGQNTLLSALFSDTLDPCFSLVVPWLRRLITSFSPRSPGSVLVGLFVDKVALAQIYLRVLRFCPVIIIPPLLHTHSRIMWFMTVGPLPALFHWDVVSPYHNNTDTVLHVGRRIKFLCSKENIWTKEGWSNRRMEKVAQWGASYFVKVKQSLYTPWRRLGGEEV